MEVTGGATIFFAFLVAASATDMARGAEITSVLGGQTMPALENGLLKLTSSSPPVARFPLVLAEKRTKRPDMLDKFRLYRGGWDITNKHYWTSVMYTGAGGFLLSALWFVSFGVAFGAHVCCGWGKDTKEEEASFGKKRTRLILLLVSTSVASTGCILLSVGQAEFHDGLLDTLHFVVNQSKFTVQILQNVTEFLSFAKTVKVEEVYLPKNVQDTIDKLNVHLNEAANSLSEKTDNNSGKVRVVIEYVRCILIVVSSLMLLLAILGLLFSVLEHKYGIYIFVISGWLLVFFTSILCGGFMVLHNASVDTCTAMDEWVRYPQAQTDLSNILPCVDEQTTNQTLYQSKEVIRQLVNIVNAAIFSTANSGITYGNMPTYFYNQSGSLVPYLCSPYDSQLHNQQCGPQDVSFSNASLVWLNYTCKVSPSGSCISVGRLTPEIYGQFVLAVNVSYALNHYTPLLLSLEDCNFVRETFDSITVRYCPVLQHDLRLVNIGLALISIGVVLCLVLWILYANRHQKRRRCLC